MRVFYAIDFDGHTKELLNESLTEIKNYIVRGSFTEKNNFHMTLLFVGECETNKLADLKKVIDDTVLKLNLSPVKAVMENLGTFARPGDELLWAGVRTEPDNTILNKISGVIFDGLNKFNIKINGSNNKFKPHITLARRVEFNKNLNGDIVKQIKFTPINFTVNSITLMESVQEIKTYGDKLYTRIIYKPLYERNF